MAAVDQGLYSLNAGEVSRLALARVDLAKLRVACEVQTNMLPRVLGPCELRPGTLQLDRTRNDDTSKLLEFVFDEQTKALLVLSPGRMRIMEDDQFISRVAVSAAIVNGEFPTDLSGWTSADEAGAVSAWVAPAGMGLTGTGENYARRDQEIIVAEPGVEHALSINVLHGIVLLQLGTVAGDNAYLEATLFPGWHSLAIVPTGNFWIRLGAQQTYQSIVRAIAIEAAGVVEVNIPWLDEPHLDAIMYDQSEDVVFCACVGVRQQRIERRSQRSWSVVDYLADDGPFRLGNTSDIQLTPSGVTGNIFMTASRAFFTPQHVGALFQLTHQGQMATAVLAGDDQWTTPPIRVSGLKPQRDITLDLSGTFVADVTLQQSLAVPGAWTDVGHWSSPLTQTYNDGLDNQVIYYRAGIKTGDYTSGAATATLSYSASIQTGVVRVNAYNAPDNVYADVLSPLGRNAATKQWAEGAWSDYRGFPAGVVFHDGRLFFGHEIEIAGSISDAFASYDPAVLGDSGAINRTITTGGRDGIRWLLSLQRLIAGTAQQEISIRSDAFDAPLTPTAFVARDCSTRGATRVRAVKLDSIGIFVSRDAKRIFKLVFDAPNVDYRAHELTRLKQEMCEAGVVDVAVQRNPDTRIWFVLRNGTAAVLTYDEEDDVAAWIPFVPSGNGQGDAIEHVAVLPGTVEDEVYFTVKRLFGPTPTTRRFIEKLAMRTECQGGPFNKTLDCHLVYDGPPTNTVAVPHLIGRDVVIWADGAPRVTIAAPVTVDGLGNVSIPGAPVRQAVIGLPYNGQIQTAKLAYGAERGTALNYPKRVARVGLVMANVGWKGVKIGRTLDQLVSLPATYRGRPLDDGEVIADYDDSPGPFNGAWNPDSRVCLNVSSPYPATIMGLSIEMDTNEPIEPPPAQGRRGG